MTKITIKLAFWQEDQPALKAVRQAVFIDEQRVPVELEWDNLDHDCMHWLAINEQGEPVGTVRMQRDGHIGRMAVLQAYRHQGVGKSLLEAVIAEAKNKQLLEIYLYAQTQVQDFYSDYGFVAEGAEYMDAGIPHITMRLRLNDKRLIGIHGGKFAIHDYQAALLDLIQQTERHLLILSYNLNPEVFDTAEMSDQLSQLARRNRYSEIKILIVDSSQMVKKGHRVVELQRRLPSSINLRRVTDRNTTIKENWVIADNIALIHQSVQEPNVCWGNFYNRPLAEDYAMQFQHLWQHAQEDPDIRQLEI